MFIHWVDDSKHHRTRECRWKKNITKPYNQQSFFSADVLYLVAGHRARKPSEDWRWMKWWVRGGQLGMVNTLLHWKLHIQSAVDTFFFEVLEVFHKIYDKISESDDGDRRTNIGERIIRKNRLKSAKVFSFFLLLFRFGWFSIFLFLIFICYKYSF